MASQRDIIMIVSALLEAGHKMSQVANFVGISRTTVFAIKKRMNNNEGVNRCASSDWKSVVDYDSLRDAIRSCFRTSMHQHARKLKDRASTVRRVVAKLGAKSRITRLISAPSALSQVARYYLSMT